MEVYRESMANQRTQFAEIYEELKAFVDESFPQECSMCGKVYNSLGDLLDDTEGVGKPGTFVNSLGYQNVPYVDMCRNCSCGSSLMVIFESRRDMSDTGRKRRDDFQLMMDLIMQQGIDQETAQRELLGVLAGHPSQLLSESMLHRPCVIPRCIRVT